MGILETTILVIMISSIFLGLMGFAEILAIGEKGRAKWLAGENMPKELWDAKLIMNETELRDEEGKAIRVDQVFQLPDGSVAVVDTKTRGWHDIRDSDRQQVERYRSALKNVYGYTLADKSYIRTVVRPDSRVFRRIRYNSVTSW